MLEVKNFTCIRNASKLFAPIQFSMNGSEVLQITGQNGIGKTTLLKTIAGLLTDYVGEVKINSQKICYLGHKPALHPQLTVAQNLQLFASSQARSNDKITQLQSTLQYFAIERKISVRCKELSAGQQQRVNLSKLLLTSADIWILDEPLINLDVQGISLLQNLCLQHLAKAGILLLATHRNLELQPYISKNLFLERVSECNSI